MNKDAWIIILAILVFLFLAITLVSCNTSWYVQDNFGEEIVEQIMDQEIGLDLDLSPATKENVKK